MDGMVRIRVCAGRKVRDDMTGRELATDRPHDVPLTRYWRRRLAVGDVERTNDPIAEAETASEPVAAPKGKRSSNEEATR